MGKPAVFLDRDGVINRYVYNPEFGTVDSPANPEEFELHSGVGQAIAAFHAMGLLVVVVSNQPGIAKGKFTAEILRATTDKMLAACGGLIDSVYYCLHHPSAVVADYRSNCNCRKPKPGLLLQAAANLNIDLSASVMIGDGLTDILAGRGAGTHTILVSPRKCYLCDAIAEKNATPDFLVSTLADAVPIVERLMNRTDLLQGARSHELHLGLYPRDRRNYRELGR